MKFLKIKLNEKILGKIDISIAEYNEDKHGSKLDFYYDEIETDLIDIVGLEDNIDIIVDDEGLLKPGIPVFELFLGNEGPAHLAGTILLGRRSETIDGIDTIGFETQEQVRDVLDNIKVRLIGFTKSA